MGIESVNKSIFWGRRGLFWRTHNGQIKDKNFFVISRWQKMININITTSYPLFMNIINCFSTIACLLIPNLNCPIPWDGNEKIALLYITNLWNCMFMSEKSLKAKKFHKIIRISFIRASPKFNAHVRWTA